MASLREARRTRRGRTRVDVTEPFSAFIAQNRFTNLLAPEDE